LARVLATVWAKAGQKQATVDDWGVSVFAGCYNDRSILGSGHLSCHAYAAAIDLDPERNPYGHDVHARHFVAGCAVVEAFKGEGWIWGGDWSGPYDPMHFQAARVR
jgi:hypothetical protein